MGGTCLHWGCIPTKALLQSSDLVSKVRDRGQEFGVKTAGVDVDMPAIVKRKNGIVDRLTKGVEGLMRKNKIELIRGHARLRDAHTLDVEGVGTIEAPQLIIASGSTPRSLPGIEVDKERIITSDDAVHLPWIPASVAIIGAGAIGVEFATFYRQMGASVTLLEALPRLVPLEDEEVSATLLKIFQKDGIDCRLGAKVEEARRTGDKVTVKADGKSLEVDLLLVAVGRTPRSAGIGLEEAGIKLGRGGIVEVDEWMRTSVDGVHAIGDVAGGYQLAHAATHEGITAVEDIAGKRVEPIRQELITRCTYCHPQVSSVGLTEAQAREGGRQIKVGKFPYAAIARALIHGDADGFVKIVADAESGTILGTHIIGVEATELIAEPALAQLFEGVAWEVARNVHPHPTMSEAIGEAAMAVDGRALNI